MIMSLADPNIEVHLGRKPQVIPANAPWVRKWAEI
jgi:hypothetical protein